MEAKLIKTTLHEYVPAQWGGENLSGIQPVGDRILVLPDEPAGLTTGGVHIPDDMKERMAHAAETGVIIACGGDAFTWNSDRTRPWGEDEKPKAGDRVIFQRYSGGLHKGLDGKFYRIMDDITIAAKSTI